MATAVASKPGATNQTKMKRPPLPAVQTNGIQSSRSSPSPLTSSKRPPSGFKAPPTPTMNGPINSAIGGQPRLSQRRKDSQKPGELARTRAGKDGERKIPKRKQEPYVKTQGHILKKYRNRQPSLVIHLHPNNFRFDQQTGSFSYTSPMKCILEHIKSQTVPHLFIEELVASGVVFYEGCLIVQIKDHRTAKTSSTSAKSTETTGSNIPSSIHNYTQWVVPSPYVPYPVRKQNDGDNKENDVNGGGAPASSSKEKPNEPKTFTVVLFPTPQSIQEEAFLQANTPDTRSGGRKGGASAIARTPSSATVPPTPLSAVPSTPIVASHSAKRLKMSISGAEIQQFESKVIAATAPPMYLETVENLGESQQLIDALTDPLHRGKHPSPKTRKRTVAELAADERIAAQEQSFMLIMDEKANVSGKAGNKDDDGNAPFEPNFETFNAIQQIKAQHDERSLHQQRHDAEQKRLELERNNAQRIRMEREHQQRAKLEKEREHEKFRLAQQRQKEIQAARMMRQQQTLAAQAAQQAQMANAQTMPLQNGYPPVNSSPVVRTATPHSNGSPVIGNVGVQGGVAMQPTSSGQGSSPARPPSSAQHGHPAAGGVHMVHNRSRQQIPSRTGTPQMGGTPNMPNATPNIPHSTPNLQQGIPTPRVTQGSPNAAMSAGPNGSMMNPQRIAAAAAQMNVTPEQFTIMMAQRNKRNEFYNQQNHIVQANQQGTAHQLQQNGQMSQANMQQAMAAQQQHNNIMQEQRRRAEAVRLQQQQQQQAAAMAALPNGHPAAASPNPSMNPQQPQQPQPPNQPPQQPRPMAPNAAAGQAGQNALAPLQQHLAARIFPQIANQAAQSLGLANANLLNAQQIKECKAKALELALAEANKMRLEQGRRQAMQNQAQNINMYRSGLGGMMRQQQQQQGQGGGMVGGAGGGEQVMGAGTGGMGGAGGNQMQQMVQNMKDNGIPQDQILRFMQQQQQQQQQQMQRMPSQQQMHQQHASALQSMQGMNNMGGMGMGNGNMG